MQTVILCVKGMPIWHVMDVMHLEKNIAESKLKLLFGEKNTPKSRKTLRKWGGARIVAATQGQPAANLQAVSAIWFHGPKKEKKKKKKG